MSINGHWPMVEGPAQSESAPGDFFDRIHGINGWFPWELEETDNDNA